MAYQWLKKEWATLFSALEQATTEAEIKSICEAQIAAWRARPSYKKESSLRVPMNDTCNEIKVRLEGERRQFALQYMKFTTEEWTRMNAGSDEALQERHENQQFIRDPDAIVAKAVELLASEQWYEIAVGLAVCTGRRLTEVLKTAEFEHKTDYSVMFKGQLKAKGEVTFEIPTLAHATLVINAVIRLRSMLDTTNMEKRDVSHKYSQAVREAANLHFTNLIPTRAGNHDELYTHLCRSIYAVIAVLYYCPLSVTRMHFMATIQGHYKYLEAETEVERRNYASTAHYSDYMILGHDGNIDGRQGIHLGMSGVALLEVFQPKKKEKKVTTDIQEQQEGKKETKYSMIKPLKGTRKRFDAIAARLGFTEHDDTLSALLDFYEQGGAATRQLSEGSTEQVAQGNQSPVDISVVIQELVNEDKGFQKYQQEKLNEQEQETRKQVLALLNKVMADRESIQTLLVEALIKEAKFQIGVDNRHADKDFSKLKTSELTGIKHKGAAKERIRRAIAAIAAYNDQAQSPNDRWFINPRAAQRIAGSRYPIINEYFAEHQSEIDVLNTKYKLNDRYNHKPYSIDAKITIPEEASVITVSEVVPVSEEA